MFLKPKYIGGNDRNRTGTRFDPRRILSPVRLPVPPHSRLNSFYFNTFVFNCQYFFYKYCFLVIKFKFFIFSTNGEKVSLVEQYLSTIVTITLSLYLGTFLKVSGHICFSIISFSISFKLKYLQAFSKAVLG